MKTAFITVMLLLCFQARAGNQQHELKIAWEVGYSKNSGTSPSKWMPASVPGAVQLDIAKAEKYSQPHYYAENWKDYLWMEDAFFTYRTSFRKPEIPDGHRLYFKSLGIDYEFEIYLNDKKIFYQEGMFTPVILDLTDKLNDRNQLLIKIFPAPKIPGMKVHKQAAQAAKPPVSYGWDWHPRLIPLGIWDETSIYTEPAAKIEDVQISYVLNDELNRADIILELGGKNLKGTKYVWTLADESGKEVLRSEGSFSENSASAQFSLDRPNLWWPHDHGKPYLYTSSVRLTDASGKVIHTADSKTGFRRVRLVMNEGGWIEPVSFPKSRSVPPVQFEINGRRIFCKGTNWVPPDIFPGTITKDRYEKLIDLAKEANFNILRVWGGGIVNKEAFYELCDEKGLMVWTEFPLAGNNYEGTPRYLSVLEQESTSIITRIRKHPSLALWCGGNELFNTWSRMTDQSPALRLLNSQCFRLDPNTPFLFTSPVMGMGHGYYVFRNEVTGEEVFQLMARARNTAYTEFGMPAPAAVYVLKKIIPAGELWPPKEGTSWESHHAFKAWEGNTWLCQGIIEDYFGKSGSLEELVANGQLLQGEGYKCIYEEARRQKPYCSIAANWCFNEPWPTAANNSIISYPDIPKPGFYAVKNACRPLLASSRFSKFRWNEGEIFNAEIWMLNDLPGDVPAGKVTIKLTGGDEVITLMDWNYKEMDANTNQAGPTIRYKLPSWDTNRFKLMLEVEGHPEYSSEYTLAYRKGR